MAAVEDRVKDTGTVTGTGAITLTNSAPTGYITFATAFANLPVVVRYCVVDASGNWEVGLGTLTTSTNLTRDNVSSSSNAGAIVTFGSAVAVDVFCTASARLLMGATTGRQIATRRNLNF